MVVFGRVIFWHGNVSKVTLGGILKLRTNPNKL